MLRNGTLVALAALLGLTMTAATSTSHLTVLDATLAAPRAPSRSAADPLRLVPAPTGNQVRYRVREQLVGHDLPNDAIGVTDDVMGALVIGEDGAVVPSESRFVVNVTKLKSDRDRRDGYVQRRILDTEKFPTVQLLPTALHGLPTPLPTSGEHTFELIGQLTVDSVTRPTTWQVKANFDGGRVTGTASTGFTFADFGLTQPRVRILLSVADSIHLEYDFNLVPAQSSAAGR